MGRPNKAQKLESNNPTGSSSEQNLALNPSLESPRFASKSLSIHTNSNFYTRNTVSSIVDFSPMDSLEAFTALQEVLVEFRAGKMNMEGKRVIPDSRKGLVRVGRGQEGLVHFQWLDRTSNAVEDDQIVFPEDAIFEKVEQASGRVYILKFHADDRKLFFWMQEPSGENDEQICNSVNFYLNLPIEFGDEDNDVSGALLQTSEDMVEEDISSRAGNLVGPSMGEVTSDVTSSGPVKLSDLQRILSNIGSSEEVVDLDPDGGLGLGDILKPELIFPLFESLPLERLASYLPGGQWTSELDLMEIIQSPPFRQQVDAFTYVLRTGQIDLTQFGIDPNKFTVLSFLEALEDSVSKTTEESSRSQTVNQQSEAMDEAH